MPRLNFFACLSYLAVTLVCVAALALGGPAFAADAASYSIDLQPVALLVVAAIAGVIALAVRTGVNALVAYLADKANIEFDQSTRAYLDTALDNALAWGTRNLSDYVAGKIPDVNVKNAMLAEAANYLTERVPAALDHFNLLPDDIEKMLEARLLKKIDAAS